MYPRTHTHHSHLTHLSAVKRAIHTVTLNCSYFQRKCSGSTVVNFQTYKQGTLHIHQSRWVDVIADHLHEQAGSQTPTKIIYESSLYLPQTHNDPSRTHPFGIYTRPPGYYERSAAWLPTSKKNYLMLYEVVTLVCLAAAVAATSTSANTVQCVCIKKSKKKNQSNFSKLQLSQEETASHYWVFCLEFFLQDLVLIIWYTSTFVCDFFLKTTGIYWLQLGHTWIK